MQNEIIGEDADTRAAQKQKTHSPKGIEIGIRRAVFGGFRVGRRSVEIRYVPFRHVARLYRPVFVRIRHVIIAVIQGVDFPQHGHRCVFI